MSESVNDVNLIWFEIDNNSCFTRINKSAQLLLEADECMLKGKNIESIFKPFHIELLKVRIASLIEGTIDSFSLRMELLNSGKKVILGIYINDLIDGQRRMIGAFQIIQEKKAFLENPKKLLIQLNHTKEAIAIRNQKGDYFFINKALIDIFGYNSSKELLGKQWTALHFPEDTQKIDAEIKEQLSLNGNFRGEIRGKKKNNSLIYLELSLTQLDNGDTLSLFKDISNKKILQP